MFAARTLLVFAALQFPVTGHCGSASEWVNNLTELSAKKMPNEPLTTLAEAKKINLASSVDGVNFDVPLTYLFPGYSHKDGGWLAVPQGEIDGTERSKIDFVTIHALLPDLAPLREDNLADFEVL